MTTTTRAARGYYTHTTKSRREASAHWLPLGNLCCPPPLVTAPLTRWTGADCRYCRPFHAGCACDVCKMAANEYRRRRSPRLHTAGQVKAFLRANLSTIAVTAAVSAVSRPLTEWERAETLLRGSIRTLLWGPPGTGKTYTAQHIGLGGRQVYNVTLTAGTPEAELRGHWVPKPGECETCGEIAAASWSWHDGPAIRAWRGGDRLVLNEIGESSEELLTFLYAIADDKDDAALTLPTGETVRPDGRFQVVATTNKPPEVLPEGLRDRFRTVHIPNVHPEALASLPEAFRKTALATASAPDDQRIGIRAWLDLVRLADFLITQEGRPRLEALADAALCVVGPRAPDLMLALDLAQIETADAWTT